MDDAEAVGNVSGTREVLLEAGDKAGIPFDEETYLRLNNDVRAAVAAGTFRSGREHFERHGRREGRPFRLAPMAREGVRMREGEAAGGFYRAVPAGAVDGVSLSQSGGIFVEGWVNDALDRLESVDLYFAGWSISFDGNSLARTRRVDAEAELGHGAEHEYGFWGFIYAARRLPAGACSVVLRMKSGAACGHRVVAELIEDAAMRAAVLCHLAEARYFGNATFAAAAAIAPAIGAQLVDFNKMLSRRAVNAPYVERFGREGRRYKGSIIVCLFGRAEYVFLQNAMFARQKGIEDYEFIYVCNSPGIAEQVLKSARQCSMIYGLDMCVILLNANAGFGAANNVAAGYARSDRLVMMNPDVFPRDANWVEKHSALLDALPAVQTDLFGAPLYYDDGALMHAGMCFCADTLPRFEKGVRREVSLLRVEHYGKGAPPETEAFLKPRPVPAVTGALMSMARAWFEKLEGFTQDYVFGHYEDADLCLKSIAAGRMPWLQDVRLWHLEGKGGMRLPQHEGGAIVNCWLFTQSWGEAVRRDLLGVAPAHAGLRGADAMARKPARRGRA